MQLARWADQPQRPAVLARRLAGGGADGDPERLREARVEVEAVDRQQRVRPPARPRARVGGVRLQVVQPDVADFD